MKRSDCYPCKQLTGGHNKRCALIDKDIRVITVCPKTPEPPKKWTTEEGEKLEELIKSGTHLRNIALRLDRPYKEVKQMMKPVSDLERDLAIYLHGYWKDLVRPLLIGSELSEKKRLQYQRGMCKFDMLEEQYKRTYRADANAILNLCACNLDTLLEFTFNSE